MTLNLSEQESQLLIQLLSRFVAEIKGEIYRTETAAYKDALKLQEGIANELLARLTGTSAAA